MDKRCLESWGAHPALPIPGSWSLYTSVVSIVNKSKLYNRRHLKFYFKKSIAPHIYLVISLDRLPPHGMEIVLYHRLFL